MNKNIKWSKLAQKIEDSIWECIKDENDSDETYEWEVTFTNKKGEKVILNNEVLQ